MMFGKDKSIVGEHFQMFIIVQQETGLCQRSYQEKK